MQPVYSGTTTGRVLRTAVLTVLLCGYAAWSLWDGYVTYPRENMLSVLEHKLGVEPPDPLPVIHPELTADAGEGIGERESLGQVAASLGGQPLLHEGSAYFFGAVGYLKLELHGATVLGHQWVAEAKRTASDLIWQKTIGFALAPLGLAFAVQLLRVLRTRVALTDAGLQIGRRKPIPIEVITGIRGDSYESTGRIDVQYTAEGRAHTLKLDDYVIKDFRPIVTAICEARGFPNPLESDARHTPDDNAGPAEG